MSSCNGNFIRNDGLRKNRCDEVLSCLTAGTGIAISETGVITATATPEVLAITSLNGLTDQIQTFDTGDSPLTINSTGSTHTFDLPTGNLIAGDNITLDGTLANRLVGAGDVTVNMTTIPFQAENGTSIDSTSNAVVLGQDVGGTGGQFISDREINQNGFDLLFKGDGKVITPNSTATAGVIYKGNETTNTRWLHNFGTDSFFAGKDSGNFTGTFASSIGIGEETLLNAVTATNIIAIGRSAAKDLTTAQNVIAIGPSSARRLTTGNFHVLIGTTAGSFLLDGTHNVFVGRTAGFAGVSASRSSFFGDGSGYFQLGNDNTFGGYEAGRAVTNAAGDRNSGFGSFSLRDMQTASDVSALGYGAGVGITSANTRVTTASGGLFLGAYASLTNIANQVVNAGAIGFRATINSAETIAIGAVNGVNGATETQAVITGGNTISSNLLQFEVISSTKASKPFTLLTEAARLAITPPIGSHVYQTDGAEGVYVYKSTGWVFAY